MIEDAKQTTGVGQARNRAPRQDVHCRATINLGPTGELSAIEVAIPGIMAVLAGIAMTGRVDV